MTVYMLVNSGKIKALSVAQDAAKVLLSCGMLLVLDETCQGLLDLDMCAKIMPAEMAYKVCDMVICVGGDGTMLKAARQTMKCNKPLLGINTGRLGFLTVLECNELEKLKRLPKKDYKIENRSVISAQIEGEREESLALNDVVLFKDKPEKTISLNIFCDDILVSRFRGDGIVFATPTGSTAYSMSAGGPILDARLEGVVVSQICAHIVQTPPLVVAANRLLRAVPIQDDAQQEIAIISDGYKVQVVKPGKAIIISSSSYKVPLIQFADTQQLEFIDKKLKGR